MEREHRHTPQRGILAAAAVSLMLLTGCAADEDPEPDGNGDATQTLGPRDNGGENGTVYIEQTDYADDVPRAAVELSDGRQLEVQAGDADLRDDVTVELRQHAEDPPSQLVVVRSEAERTLYVSTERAGESPVDGVSLFASPLDIGYERGEYEYGSPPETAVAVLPPGSEVPVNGVSPDAEVVCLELVEEWNGIGTGPPEDYTGLQARGFYRSSEGTLELACGEPVEGASALLDETWAFDFLDIEPPEQQDPVDTVIIESEVTETEDGHHLEITLETQEDIEVRQPEELDTFFVVRRDAQWIWEPGGEHTELTSGEELLVSHEFPREAQSATDTLEICFEVLGEDLAQGACHEVGDW